MNVSYLHVCMSMYAGMNVDIYIYIYIYIYIRTCTYMCMLGMYVQCMYRLIRRKLSILTKMFIKN